MATLSEVYQIEIGSSFGAAADNHATCHLSLLLVLHPPTMTTMTHTKQTIATLCAVATLYLLSYHCNNWFHHHAKCHTSTQPVAVPVNGWHPCSVTNAERAIIRITGPPTQLHRLVARTCSAFYGDNHPHSTARCRLAEQQARLTASAAGANTTHASIQLQLEADHTTAHASTVYSNAAYNLWPWRELRVRLGPAQLTVDSKVRNECRRLKVPELHCLEALLQADAALEGIHSKYRERCRLRRQLSKRTGVAVEWRTATTGAMVEPVNGQHSGIEWTAVAPRVKSNALAWEMYQRGVTTAPTLSPEDATRWPPPPVESSLPANHTAALQSQLRRCMQSTRLRDLPFGSVYHHYVEISREKVSPSKR